MRTLPHSKADGAGDPGNHRRADAARQHGTIGISPNLARHPAGDWRSQVDPEQRFVGRTLRLVPAGHVSRVSAECSRGISTKRSVELPAELPGRISTQCPGGWSPRISAGSAAKCPAFGLAESRGDELFRRGEKCLAHTLQTRSLLIQLRLRRFRRFLRCRRIGDAPWPDPSF